MCVWGVQLLQKMEQQMGREQLMILFRHLTTVVLNKRHTINTEMDDLKEVLSLAHLLPSCRCMLNKHNFYVATIVSSARFAT